jgi:hypothetical protein
MRVLLRRNGVGDNGVRDSLDDFEVLFKRLDSGRLVEPSGLRGK